MLRKIVESIKYMQKKYGCNKILERLRYASWMICMDR
jgi:hypothetical protein